MPHVIPANADKFSIYKTIESKVKLTVVYGTRQCDMLSVPESTSVTWRLSVKTAPEKQRIIIIGFQTSKDGDQTKTQSDTPRLIIICRSPTRSFLECMVMWPCL